MYYAKILIGNTSSGIIEAASFGKYVVNVGDRQKGRVQSGNCIDTLSVKEKIINATKRALEINKFEGENLYYKSATAELIINKLKSSNETL